MLSIIIYAHSYFGLAFHCPRQLLGTIKSSQAGFVTARLLSCFQSYEVICLNATALDGFRGGQPQKTLRRHLRNTSGEYLREEGGPIFIK